VTDELRHHWTLHEIDEESVRLEAERAKLPEQRRVQESRIASERRRLEALDAQVAEWVRRRRDLEREAAALEAQEKKYRLQLDAVTNQHQFEAVQHEIAGVAAKRSTLETGVLERMDDEERAAASRPALLEALAKAEREAGGVLAKLGAEDERLAAELAALAARREAAAARLEPAARSRYERLRTGRGGRAVSAIVQTGVCGGCFRALPPHGLQEAKKRERLLVCDGCGRLVMLPPEG
jgi:uncharacterized protein